MKLHAHYWEYRGNHHGGKDVVAYDPHGFGIANIATMAWALTDVLGHGADSAEATLVRKRGVKLDDCRLTIGKEQYWNRMIKVAATREQWDALIEAKKDIDSAYENAH